jgi:holo-[acyl-carrier protein] synthase
VQGNPPTESNRPILAVGIDLVEIAEVEESLGRFGDRYLLHVFTAHERAQFTGRTEGRRRIRHLAACFAVKEAAKKVLAPDDAEALDWQTLEVHEQGSSGIAVRLSGTAGELAARRGITTVSGSVACDLRHALAVVTGHGGDSV